MNWKQIIWRLLLAVILVGALVFAGFALYRAGYARGIAASAAGDFAGRHFSERGPMFNRGLPPRYGNFAWRAQVPFRGFNLFWAFPVPLLGTGLVIVGAVALGFLIALLLRGRSPLMSSSQAGQSVPVAPETGEPPRTEKDKPSGKKK